MQPFRVEFLLGLLKRQIGHVFKLLCIALLIQLCLLLAMLAAQGGARWLRRAPAPAERLATA